MVTLNLLGERSGYGHGGGERHRRGGRGAAVGRGLVGRAARRGHQHRAAHAAHAGAVRTGVCLPSLAFHELLTCP